MCETYPLTTLEIGEKGNVFKINSDGSIRRRLQEIGLIEGTKVECVIKSPACDPIAYEIRGSVIALRNKESDKIIITKELSHSGNG